MAATATAALRATVGFLTFLIAFTFRRGHAPSWWFGVVLIASMGGSLLGALIAPRLRRRVVEERLVAGALLLIAAAAIIAGRVNGRTAAALLAFAVGVSANAGKLAFDSLVQRDAPDAAQGRAFARFESEFQLAWVIGALLPVLLHIPERVGFFVMAVGTGVAALMYLTGRRALGASVPASVGEVDAGEPEAGRVDFGGSR